MVRLTQSRTGGNKVAETVKIEGLVVIQAYAKVFKSGKRGWFGKAMDPRTGKKYQIVAAVEIGS